VVDAVRESYFVKLNFGGARTDNHLAFDRPQCAALIGAIAMAWSSVEQTLALYFSLFVNGMGGWSGVEHTIALEAFDSVDSFRQKQELLLVAARRRFNGELVDELDRLLKKRIWKAGTRRNSIIHGRWFISDRYPDALIHVKRIGSDMSDAKIYGPRELTVILESINAAHGELDALFRAKLQPELEIAGKRFVASMKTVVENQ
jgi:hypothetical protein